MKQNYIAKFNGQDYKFIANPMHLREVAMVILCEQKTNMAEIFAEDGMELQFICRFNPDVFQKADAEKNGYSWNDFQFLWPESQVIKPNPKVHVLIGDGVDDLLYYGQYRELHRMIDDGDIREEEREFDTEDEKNAFCDGVSIFCDDERAPQEFVILEDAEYEKIMDTEYDE